MFTIVRCKKDLDNSWFSYLQKYLPKVKYQLNCLSKNNYNPENGTIPVYRFADSDVSISKATLQQLNHSFPDWSFNFRGFPTSRPRRVFVPSLARSIFDKYPVAGVHISNGGFDRDACFSSLRHGCATKWKRKYATGFSPWRSVFRDFIVESRRWILRFPKRNPQVSKTCLNPVERPIIFFL